MERCLPTVQLSLVSMINLMMGKPCQPTVSFVAQSGQKITFVESSSSDSYQKHVVFEPAALSFPELSLLVIVGRHLLELQALEAMEAIAETVGEFITSSAFF